MPRERLLFFLVTGLILIFTSTAVADIELGDRLVIAAGDTINEALCFGNDVYVYGTVKRDAVSFGGDVVVESGGTVKGDVVALGGDVRVRNNGTIGKDTVSVGGEIIVDYGGQILGDKVDLSALHKPFEKFGATALCNVSQSAGDVLSGVSKTILFGPFVGFMGAIGIVIMTALLMMKLLFKCAIAAFITYLAPRHVRNMAECVRTNLFVSLLAGFVTMVIFPFLIILLLVSLIGIPLVPLAIILLIIVYFFGSVGVALWAGLILPLSQNRSDIHNALLGVLAIGLVRFIPIIGFLSGFFAGILAVGVVVVTRFGAEHYPRSL